MTSTVPPAILEPFLGAADEAARQRDDVDQDVARELMEEAATLLHNSLALDDLDDHDLRAAVAGLSGALVAPSIRSRRGGRWHPRWRTTTRPCTTRRPCGRAYLVAVSVLQLYRRHSSAEDQPEPDHGRDQAQQQPQGEHRLAVDRAEGCDGDGTEDPGDHGEPDPECRRTSSSITPATTRPTTRWKIVVTARTDMTHLCTRARSRASFSGSWTTRRGAFMSSRWPRPFS